VSAGAEPGWLAFGNNDIGASVDISSGLDHFLFGPTYGAGLYDIVVSWLPLTTTRTSLDHATRTLTATGDPMAIHDAIVISSEGSNLRVTVNGQVVTVPLARVTGVNVLAWEGNDTVTVANLPEQLLAEDLKLSIVGNVTVDRRDTSPKTADFTSLVYRRVEGKFRIAVEEGTQTAFADENNWASHAWKVRSEVPWLECPRDVKLKTFPKLPQLLLDITKNVEKVIADVEKAKPEVEEVLHSLK